VDCVARFVNPWTVVAVRDREKGSANYQILQANWDCLRTSTGQNGKKLDLVALPVPGRVKIGRRDLPASYANFYIGNRTVLVPIFGTRNDGRALGLLRELFAKRRVVGIRSNALVSGLGGIHCATMQEPAY